MAREYTYRQLESLWLSAGGRRTLAPVMAAIAEAESGGNPDAENPSGATGLWQILGAVRPRDQSHLTDPNVNAREAVLKLDSQGLDAWTTYSGGEYRKFLQGPPGPGNQQVASASQFVKEAEKFDGTPYVWGGAGPGGFDCSGLVQYSLQKLGLKNVPRTSEDQWNWVARISEKDLKPGDLVFYAGSDGTDTAPGHVAIYTGGGQVVQAEETGTNVGKFPVDAAGKPVGYGRVPGLTGVTGGTNPGPGGNSGGGGVDWSGWLSDIGQALGGVIPGGAQSLTAPAGAITGAAGPLAGIAEALVHFEQRVAWFLAPSSWVRIGAFFTGAAFVGIGLAVMVKGANPIPVSAYGVSTEIGGGGSFAPAVGIFAVTIGAVLLFVAFHNLPGVSNVTELISYLQGALQRQGAQAVPGGGNGG